MKSLTKFGRVYAVWDSLLSQYVYVGQTTVRSDHSAHGELLRDRWGRVHSWEYVVVQEWESITIEDLNRAEDYFIKLLGTGADLSPHGLNLKLGGQLTSLGRIRQRDQATLNNQSSAWRAQRSTIQRRVSMTPERQRAFCATLRRNWSDPNKRKRMLSNLSTDPIVYMARMESAKAKTIELWNNPQFAASQRSKMHSAEAVAKREAAKKANRERRLAA
jgi:hypothetical protein